VRLADLTIEVCDGRPSHLDRDLDYWIGTVERYCPWGAVPVRLRWVVPRGLLTRDTTYALSVIDARPRGG